MVSSANSLVQQWVQAFNGRDLAAIVALYTEDAELFDSGMHRSRHGRGEIEDWFRLRFASMPTNVYEPGADIAWREDGAVVPWKFHGRSPQLLGQAWLSRPFEVEGTSYFTFCEQKICRQHGIYDHLAALKQTLPFLRWCPAFVAHFLYSLYLRRHHLW